MALDGVSLGTDGVYQSDSDVPNAGELFSFGIFSVYLSPGSVRALSIWTDGVYQYDEDVPDGEELFTFGFFTGTIAGAVSLPIFANYLNKRKRSQEGSYIPGLP